jgi:hypothetical protein
VIRGSVRPLSRRPAPLRGRRSVLAITTLCALVSGCAGLDSPHATTSTRRPPQLAQAQATHEYPSPPPPRETVSRAEASAMQAVRSFATSYINWSAQNVAADMRALAARSIGQARSAMALAAAQTANDYELQRGGIANSGAVEAVAPMLGHHAQYVVVTRESTTATNTNAYQGLRPAWHVAIGTVVELAPDQWVVSGWQPES